MAIKESLIILEYLLDFCVQGEEERNKISCLWNQLATMIEQKEVGLQLVLRVNVEVECVS